MAKGSKPPKTYRSFVERYPELGQAWELVRRAGAGTTMDAVVASALAALRSESGHAAHALSVSSTCSSIHE